MSRVFQSGDFIIFAAGEKKTHIDTRRNDLHDLYCI